MTDSEIIAACKSHQPKAQELLYNRYAGRLMGICTRYGASREEAQDIFQEAFIKVFENIHTVQHAETLNAWVKKIVINTAINHYHKHQKRYTALPEAYTETEFDDSHSKIIDELSHEELLALVQQLPTGYKFVFNLYAIEGYTHKEIADLLQTSESNSKNQYAKAKKALQKLLANKFGVLDSPY
jgi:RNA polymerase sigma-70 factor (ECF subfamily)